METTQLIMLLVGSVGSLIIGAITKKYTKVPNGLIPLINGTLATIGFATLGGLGFTQAAILAGMASAYTATATYEAARLKPAEADQ